MGYITSADCTLTKERTPLSPRSSSCITRPYSTLDIPAQPYPFRLAPKKPSSAMGLTSSRGKRPTRLHCSMIGTRFASIIRRVVERTRRSSSESRESNSMKSTPLNLKTGITPLPFQNWVSAGWARCRKSTPAQGKPYKLAEQRGRVKPAGLRIRSRRCLVRRTPVWLHVLSEKSEDVLPPDINTVEEESVPGGPGI